MTDALDNHQPATPGRSFDHEAGHGCWHHRPLRRVVRLRHLRVCGDHTGGGVLCLLGSDRSVACRVRHVCRRLFRPSTGWSLFRIARRQDWTTALPCHGRRVDVVVHLCHWCASWLRHGGCGGPGASSPARIFQGFSAGGEIAGAASFINEYARATSEACCRVCYPPLPRWDCCSAQYC